MCWLWCVISNRLELAGESVRACAEALSAAALNLIRLHAYWNDHPMERTRTSHLARLHLTQAA